MFLRLHGFQLTQGQETSVTRSESCLDEQGGKSKQWSPSSLADAHVAVASGLWDEELSESSTALERRSVIGCVEF